MTLPRWSEVNQILYLDQLLVYCVVVLDATNNDEYNTWWKNAAARPEAKNAIKWAIVTDDQGQKQFVWTCVLDYWNPSPLLSKPSLLGSILTITPHQMVNNLVTVPTDGSGLLVPNIPPEIETLEQLLWWCTKCIEVALLYVQYVNYCNANLWVPASLPIVSFGINPSIVIPSEFIEPLPTPDGGNNTITVAQAFDKLDPDNSSPIPNWLSNSVTTLASRGDSDSGSGSGSSPQQVDIGKAMNPADPIYVDPQAGNCKEQDPSVVAYSEKGYTFLFEVIPEQKTDAKK